jgi:hypothetical protein
MCDVREVFDEVSLDEDESAFGGDDWADCLWYEPDEIPLPDDGGCCRC